MGRFKWGNNCETEPYILEKRITLDEFIAKYPEQIRGDLVFWRCEWNDFSDDYAILSIFDLTYHNVKLACSTRTVDDDCNSFIRSSVSNINNVNQVVQPYVSDQYLWVRSDYSRNEYYNSIIDFRNRIGNQQVAVFRFLAGIQPYHGNESINYNCSSCDVYNRLPLRTVTLGGPVVGNCNVSYAITNDELDSIRLASLDASSVLMHGTIMVNGSTTAYIKAYASNIEYPFILYPAYLVGNDSISTTGLSPFSYSQGAQFDIRIRFTVENGEGEYLTEQDFINQYGEYGRVIYVPHQTSYADMFLRGSVTLNQNVSFNIGQIVKRVDEIIDNVSNKYLLSLRMNDPEAYNISTTASSQWRLTYMYYAVSSVHYQYFGPKDNVMGAKSALVDMYTGDYDPDWETGSMNYSVFYYYLADDNNGRSNFQRRSESSTVDIVNMFQRGSAFVSGNSPTSEIKHIINNQYPEILSGLGTTSFSKTPYMQLYFNNAVIPHNYYYNNQTQRYGGQLTELNGQS